METPPAGLWGVDAKLEPLPGGHRNIVLRTVGLDVDLVFKTTRHEQAAIEWLLPVYSLAEACNLPVPRPLKSSAGQYVENGWTCELFIRGKGFEKQNIGHIRPDLAHFQFCTSDFPQRPGCFSASDFLQRDQGGDIDLRAMPSDIVALCRWVWSDIAERRTCVVHGDLNPGNFIWAEDGGMTVLDWDECRVDAALFDNVPLGFDTDKAATLAKMAWEVACSWHLEPEYAIKLAAEFRLAAGQGMKPP